jgi:hypothetical protein
MADDRGAVDHRVEDPRDEEAEYRDLGKLSHIVHSSMQEDLEYVAPSPGWR